MCFFRLFYIFILPFFGLSLFANNTPQKDPLWLNDINAPYVVKTPVPVATTKQAPTPSKQEQIQKATTTLNPKCRRPMRLKATGEASLFELIESLAQRCDFSIIIKDELAKSILTQSAWGINARKMSLYELLELLLAEQDLEYKLSNNTLIISAFANLTQRLDYITSVREGQAVVRSSVDVLPEVISKTNDNAKSVQRSEDNIIKTSERFEFWDSLQTQLKAILSSPSALSTEQKPGQDAFASQLVINPAAGLIYMRARPSQIKRAREYLLALKERILRQVQIDVAIIAVEFKDSKNEGIDWSKFELSFDSLINNAPSSAGITRHSSYLNIGASAHFSMDGLLNFLNTSASTKIISRPRILSLNNQQAIISVGENINYRMSETTEFEASTLGKTKTTFNQYSMFVGILLNITAQISDDGRVMMRINPSLSSLSPGEEKFNGIREIAPDTMQKKLSTVVQVLSGDTVILGGLIGESDASQTSRVSGLSSIPLLGLAFRHKGQKLGRSELVFVITPRILE